MTTKISFICLLIIVVTFLSSWYLKYYYIENYITKNWWAYEEGAKIGQGDFVEFDDTNYFEFNKDTFYVKGKPKSILVGKKLFQNRIIIQDLESLKIGSYIIKGVNILNSW